MWQYLVFNSAWLAVLFFVNFLGIKTLRVFVLFLIFAAAAVTAVRPGVDPIAWFYYVAFSLLAYWSSFQFHKWALAKTVALDDELEYTSKKFETEGAALREKTAETGLVQRKADEISHLYEKSKEMSQSLDMLETFLVFGEALAKHFRFDVIKLALFNEEEADPRRAGEVYDLREQEFQGLFDRGAVMKEKKKHRAELFPSEQRICESVFNNKKAFHSVAPAGGEAPFIAQPVFIDKKLFAILMLFGVDEKELPVLAILIQRFIAEAQRVKLYHKIETLAITDGLTDVYVRRHLLERLEEEIDRSKRFGFKLSFLMIDVDHFKLFNDQYGHLVGDVVLKQVADTIKKNVREVDLAGRYGGEEFGVLLIDTDEEGAFFVAERIRKAVADRAFKAYDENLKVTISIGCSTFSQKINAVDLLVDTADSALYQAKRQGRNKVCLSSISATS